MPASDPQNLYQSPPGSGNNDGALPTTWDPKWPRYQNLTSAQVAAFQGFPQDLIRYARIKRWQIEMAAIDAIRCPYDDGSAPVTPPNIGQLVSGLVSGVNGSHAKMNQALQGINANTITTRAQVDAAMS